MGKKLTTEEFIEKARGIHCNKYDYTLVEYKSAHKKIKIICPEHGIFEQTPNNHKFGFGCLKCGQISTGKSRTITEELVINQFKNIHEGKYDYSKVNYIGDNKKVIIICPEHGEFEQTPSNHKSGEGCSKCSKKYIPSNNEIIDEFIKTHGNKFDYSKVNYMTHHKKITIICPKHGEFEQTPNSHKSGAGCPTCSESKGEREIRNLLITKNIKYIPQHKFSTCKNQKKLIFDFYLPELNTCIEFNGIQHYKPITFFGGIDSFKSQQKRDKIKMEYCQKNNIPLIIIRYDDKILNKLDFIQM